MKDGQPYRCGGQQNHRGLNDLAERKHFGDIYERAMLNDLQAAGNAGEFCTRAVTAFMVDRIDPKPGEIIMDPSCGTGGF
jgi:type I restriction enzyme M protein